MEDNEFLKNLEIQRIMELIHRLNLTQLFNIHALLVRYTADD